MLKTKRILCIIMAAIMFIASLPAVNVKAANEKIIEETEDDIVVIPDKNNTGCKGTLIDYSACTSEQKAAWTNGLEIGGGGYDSDGKVRDYVVNVKHVEPKTDWYEISNVDFSKFGFYFANFDERTFKVRFTNCKFKSFRGCSKVQTEFIDCSMESVNAINMTCKNCQLGHSYNDTIRAFNDVYFEGCYITDLQYPYYSDNPDASQHIDGLQIFGNLYDSETQSKGEVASNINFYNCRFEIPTYFISENNKASMNDCIMVQPEYSDAKDIHFERLVLNGAGYQFSAHKGQDHRSKAIRSVDDISLKDCRMGEGSILGVMTTVDPFVKFENIGVNSNLYVASSSQDDEGKTHFSVTNDTSRERRLTIVTDKGITTRVIPAFPLASVTNNKSANAKRYTYADFPIDIDIAVEADKYAICYDTTYEPKQIRFVKYNNDTVKFDESLLQEYCGKIEVIKEGKCGNNLTYKLTSDGVLTISGTGAMSNFHSASYPGWNRADDAVPAVPLSPLSYIRKVVVEEGVTTIGAQAFSKCTTLQEVVLPSTLERIEGRAFAGCSSLLNLTFPASLKVIGVDAFTGTFALRMKYLGDDFSKVEGGAGLAWQVEGAENLHVFNDQSYITNADGTHYRKCKDCPYYLPSENCSGGTATCSHGPVCEKCNGVYGQAVSANHVETAIKNQKEATCTEKGYTGDEYCIECNGIMTHGIDIEPLGHQWDLGVVTKEPTVEAFGEKTFTCARCNETRIESIDKLKAEEVVVNSKPEICVKGKLNVRAFAENKVKGTDNEGKIIKAYAITTGSKKAAKISKKGILTAKKPGEITITAYADKKKKQEITTVELTIKNTKIVKKDIVRYMDEAYDLKSKLTDAPNGKEIKFSIPKKMEKYATVNESTGIITPKKNGKLKVTCTITDGTYSVKLYSMISIKTPVINGGKNITVSKENIKTVAIKNADKNANIEWIISDKSKAEIVDSSNKTKIKIKGLADGETQIIANVDGHKITGNIIVN